MTSLPVSLFRNGMELHEYLCRPLCREADIQQGELDILLFLANHPGMDTAGDIQKTGGMKQSMVSILVERLVQGGYLERQSIPGDRRKVKLVCTEKAIPVIEKGQEIRKKMMGYLGEGITAEEFEAFGLVMAKVGQNMARCREQMRKGELE